ncbi:hypothetical protein PC110_g6496 [Phytophthora cactorum]|uniref:C2H2-type domain-containing protein n=1 Tax=Phytophthora cactorum TaxID=29920 RepID=A0A329SNH4_9STRA|nr:hypothetical protein PC110_g6496 [Phytophthora cactorum]
MTYISNLSHPSNLKRVAELYKVNIDKLKKYISEDYKTDPKYRFYKGTHMESHLYEGIQAGEFYDKLENVLESQKNAFKISIALGYDLISKDDDSFSQYWHPNIGNTAVFDNPVAINRKADIRKKLIPEICSMELADKLKYPSSGYKLRAITGFKIYIYHREHALGDSSAIIPKIIRDNKHVINFLMTSNKCVFHYIAYHTRSDPKKDYWIIQALVKEAFNRYCSYKGYSYSTKLFRNFKPIDLLQLDEMEDCFKLSISVYTMDVESGKIKCIRPSDKKYERLYILSHENHALYISNLDMLQSKYQCPKCEMIFVSSDKLKNHKKNQCELANIESYPAEPTICRPPQTTIKSMLTKYSIKNFDHYIDHFIVYDFEAILKPTGIQHGESTIFTNEHIPVSVSVADSLSGNVRCFVNAEPNDLLKDMFNYIEESDLFAVIGTENIKSVIKNPSYMCSATSDLKMLDISNYVPAGTSYEKYLSTYLGECECNDKIRCVCGLAKGLFPYEHIKSFDVLNPTSLPSKSDFNSDFRETTIGNAVYERVRFVWKHYEMKKVKDLLIWYNNLDVVPFINAIEAQRELFKRFDLDMFPDRVSLPGISEKVMYQTCFNELQHPSKVPAKAFRFSAKRMSGYKHQDVDAKPYSRYGFSRSSQ